jgi:hypothetical protein
VYANRWNVLDYKWFELLQYRSGQALAFYNRVVFPKISSGSGSGSNIGLYEQYPDDVDAATNPTWLLNKACLQGHFTKN